MLFSRSILTLAALALLLPPSTSQAEDGFLYVEGQVFDARSLGPVPGVQLSALAALDTVCTPEGDCPPIAAATTDRNGFFQLRVRDADSLRSESILVAALCVVTNRDGDFLAARSGSAEAHPVESERILRRDIYLRLPRRLNRATACDPAGVLPEEPAPAIGRPPDFLP